MHGHKKQQYTGYPTQFLIFHIKLATFQNCYKFWILQKMFGETLFWQIDVGCLKGCTKEYLYIVKRKISQVNAIQWGSE